jgi:hypothetical protein
MPDYYIRSTAPIPAQPNVEYPLDSWYVQQYDFPKDDSYGHNSNPVYGAILAEVVTQNGTVVKNSSNGFSVSLVQLDSIIYFKLSSPYELKTLGHLLVNNGVYPNLQYTAVTHFQPRTVFRYRRVEVEFETGLFDGTGRNATGSVDSVWTSQFPPGPSIKGQQLVKAKWFFGDRSQEQEIEADADGIARAVHSYSLKSQLSPILFTIYTEDNFGLKGKAPLLRGGVGNASYNLFGIRFFFRPSANCLPPGHIACWGSDAKQDASEIANGIVPSIVSQITLQPDGSFIREKSLNLLSHRGSHYQITKVGQMSDGRVFTFSQASELLLYSSSSITKNTDFAENRVRVWEIYVSMNQIPGYIIHTDIEQLADGSMSSILIAQVGQDKPTMRYKRSSDGLNWPSWNNCPTILTLNEVDYYFLKAMPDGSLLISNGYDKFYRLKTLDPKSEDDLEKLDVTQEQ